MVATDMPIYTVAPPDGAEKLAAVVEGLEGMTPVLPSDTPTRTSTSSSNVPPVAVVPCFCHPARQPVGAGLLSPVVYTDWGCR